MAVTTGLGGAQGYGKVTQTADTVITRLIEPKAGCITRIRYLKYTAAGTAHTLTVMRPLGKTSLTAAAAASQAVVNVQINPGNYSAIATALGTPTCRTSNNLAAANDFVAYQCADGTWVLDTISSISSLAITLTSNVPTGGLALGTTLWWFGIITDTNPGNAEAHPQFTLTASTAVTFGSVDDNYAGWLGSLPAYPTLGMSGFGEPMVCHSGNATAAGTLNEVSALYTLR
jgi:hypothetical protein